MSNNKEQNQILETGGFIVPQKQLELDLKMVPFDVWASMAHVLMLHKQKIIDAEKTKKILAALFSIEKEVHNGNFFVDPGKGAQLTLEAKIIELADDAGQSVHTGRSRNDQVIVTELLFLREKVLSFLPQLMEVVEALLLLAKKNQQMVMPGYTHMQPAKPTTVGQWVLAYANAFSRAAQTIMHYYDMYNMNPLGACESYGTSWFLDREYTAKLLGFKQVWEVPQDAIGSRGFPQLGYLSGLSEVCLVASKISQDLILFNMFEFGIIELGQEVAMRMHPITGSSVMAQKKNPDVLELIRATAPQVSGYVGIVSNILDSLFMGYNRDVREVKEYVVMGFYKTTTALNTLENVIHTVEFNKERMNQLVIKNYSLTTELADYISQKTGIGYRLIYKIIGTVVDEAIQNKKTLLEITAKEIINKAEVFGIDLVLTQKEILEAIDPKIAIEKKKHIGGTSQKTMSIAIKNTRTKTMMIDKWIKKNQAYTHNANLNTHILAKKITNKT